jgi:hypothetical protein
MIVWKLLNQRLKLVSRPIDVVKKKIHAVTEKIPGYIDFKTINDIMNGRRPSKNLELSPSDSMRLKYAFNATNNFDDLIIIIIFFFNFFFPHIWMFLAHIL